MHLHEALQARGAVALTGLGGIGKTQAALAYADAHRQDYSAVLWVRAATREELIAGFTELATVLSLPERNAAEQAQSVAAVQRWLARLSPVERLEARIFAEKFFKTMTYNASLGRFCIHKL